MEESRVNNAEMRRRERAREGQRIFSAVGRPYVHPFHHKEVEEDFYQRAVRMVELYFDLSDPAAKKPVRLSDTCRMGKTAFWAFIYCFLLSSNREIEGQPASARKAMEKLRDQYRTVLRYFYTCLDVQF